jgi:hypothetical protein
MSRFGVNPGFLIGKLFSFFIETNQNGRNDYAAVSPGGVRRHQDTIGVVEEFTMSVQTT